MDINKQITTARTGLVAACAKSDSGATHVLVSGTVLSQVLQTLDAADAQLAATPTVLGGTEGAKDAGANPATINEVLRDVEFALGQAYSHCETEQEQELGNLLNEVEQAQRPGTHPEYDKAGLLARVHTALFHFVQTHSFRVAVFAPLARLTEYLLYTATSYKELGSTVKAQVLMDVLEAPAALARPTTGAEADTEAELQVLRASNAVLQSIIDRNIERLREIDGVRDYVELLAGDVDEYDTELDCMVYEVQRLSATPAPVTSGGEEAGLLTKKEALALTLAVEHAYAHRVGMMPSVAQQRAQDALVKLTAFTEKGEDDERPATPSKDTQDKKGGVGA